jgi:hypothetical protein
VIGEDEEWKPQARDVLGSIDIWDETYEVYSKQPNGWELEDTCDDLEEATDYAHELETEDGLEMKVVNSSGVVVFRS